MHAFNSGEIMTIGSILGGRKERRNEMRRKSAVLTLCLSTDEGMHSKDTATLHQLGVLLLSLSPSFPPNQPILKIESIYHHLTPLQTTCLDTFQVLFWHSWVPWCSQIVQLFYFLTTVSHHSTLINQNPSMLFSAFSMLLTSFDEGYSPPLNLLCFILAYWGYWDRKKALPTVNFSQPDCKMFQK